MKNIIVTHPSFDAVWPFAANRLAHYWLSQGGVAHLRTLDDDTRTLREILAGSGLQTEAVTRLITLGIPVTPECIAGLPSLQEVALMRPYDSLTDPVLVAALKARGIKVYAHKSEGFWGQSVSEFALGLTLAALRRIPQTYAGMRHDPSVWEYAPPEGAGRGRPGARGQQYGDDSRFTSGTIEGKRVRIVGAGNIASRYASFTRMLGAEVSAWDPFAPESSFHRAGSKHELHLDRLVRDAEIFAPMVPLTESTRGIVTREHIHALPKGCLVVLATRALICDMPALRARVLADELSLAADVFDVEPLPFDDPLLGRHNVVHTPHNAGRTQQANERWAEMLAAQFRPEA